MNGYWILALLVSFVTWSGFMYYEGSSKEIAVCGKSDAQHDLTQADATIAAKDGVIATVGQQQAVTQGVDYAYQAKKSDIDKQYIDSFVSVRTTGISTDSNLCPVGSTSGRPNAAPARPLLTTVFKITPKECDENTEQLYGLQAWVKGQQKVKQPGTTVH